MRVLARGCCLIACGVFPAFAARNMQSKTAVPRMPGFVIQGRPFVGRALLARGKLVVSGNRFLDFHIDVQSEDNEGIEWLDCKRARKAWQAWTEQLKQEVARLQAALSNVQLEHAPVDCNFDKAYLCWNCKQPFRHRTECRCGKCLQAYYCCRDCQRAHWKRGHKHTCTDAAAG